MGIDITRERIRGALASVLYPLARILLRCGVGYAEFAELAKQAYVEAASGENGGRERPVNTARIALVTGLPRKEVMRIRRNRKLKIFHDNHYMTLPAVVLNTWHSDRRYCNRFGIPKVLAFSGKENSFCSLVRSLCRNVSAAAMRSELVRSGAIQAVGQNSLLATKRHYVPESTDNKILVGLDLGLGRLAETIDFNSGKGYTQGARFQRFVHGPLVLSVDLPKIRKEVQLMLTNFSLKVDDYMASFDVLCGEKAYRKKPSQSCSMGIGLYYFDDSLG